MSGIGTRRPAERPDGGTLRERTYEALKALILSGELRPGERLAEEELARRLRVSRTPLREALSRLSQEKLVVGRPHFGYVVIELDAKSIKDLLDTREVLDAHAASLVAGSGSDEDLQRLRDCLLQLEAVLSRRRTDEPDLGGEIALGVRLHEIVAEATGNQVLVDMLRQIYDRLQLAMWLEVLWVDPWEVSLQEHRDIVEAICDRDPARSAEAARIHVRRSLQNMLRVTEARQRISGGRPRAVREA